MPNETAEAQVEVGAAEGTMSRARRVYRTIKKHDPSDTFPIRVDHLMEVCMAAMAAEDKVAAGGNGSPTEEPPAKEPLTQKQQDVLNAIKGMVEEEGTPPSLRQIAEKMGYKSHNAARVVVDALEKKGYLVRTSETKAIVLVP